MKKVVVITGGAQGIGRGISMVLHQYGYQTVIIDIDREAGIEMETIIPGTYYIQADVSVENEVKSAVRDVISKYGAIDFLINNAGIGINKPIDELSLDEWKKVIDVNLTSVFLFTKHAKEWLIKSRGAIINIASTRALMSEPNTEAYSASKGGVVAITHALAVSLGPHVRVNCISPGWIEVSNYQKKSEALTPVHTEADKMQHPAGRVGTPNDIANCVYFLISNENSFITGQNFVIDGGMTKRMIYV